jgi:hypothetical protein
VKSNGHRELVRVIVSEACHDHVGITLEIETVWVGEIRS